MPSKEEKEKRQGFWYPAQEVKRGEGRGEGQSIKNLEQKERYFSLQGKQRGGLRIPESNKLDLLPLASTQTNKH